MLKKLIYMPYDYKVIAIQKKIQWLYKRFKYKNFGKNSVIQKPLMLVNEKFITIGENCVIRKNIRLEPINKYYNCVFQPNLIIGDNTIIEQNCHINCANEVIIGSNVTVSSYVYITDVNHNYEQIDVPILNQPLEVKSTVIGNCSFIGTGSKILAGVKIGKQCIVGANSVVTKNLPDYCVAVGNPARIIKKYNFERKTWEKFEYV